MLFSLPNKCSHHDRIIQAGMPGGFEMEEAQITEHQDITIAIPLMSELLKRFEEEKKEFPDLTLSAFCTWAIRYYLQHAYLPPNDNKFYRG
jgi:hypothetical protein